MASGCVVVTLWWWLCAAIKLRNSASFDLWLAAACPGWISPRIQWVGKSPNLLAGCSLNTSVPLNITIITILPLYNYLVLWKYSIFPHLLKHTKPRNPDRDTLKHRLEFWKSMISSSSLRCWDSFHYRVCVRPGQMCDRWVIILLWRSHWSHTASLCRSHRRLITASFDQTDKLTAADQMSFLPFCLHQSPVTNHVSEDSIQFFHTLDGLLNGHILDPQTCSTLYWEAIKKAGSKDYVGHMWHSTWCFKGVWSIGWHTSVFICRHKS